MQSALGLAQLALQNAAYPGAVPLTPTAWSAVGVVYAAGWAAPVVAAPVEYRRTSDGTVQLRGITGRLLAGAGTPMFTLPVGFRPAIGRGFAATGNDPAPGTGNLVASIQIAASGDVSLILPAVTAGAAAQIVVDGVTFSTVA